MINNLAMKPLYEVSKLIKQKKISPVDLVEACKEKIESRNDTLLAYCTLTLDFAMEQAKKAECEIMKNGPRSPLHGIPYGLKDLFYTKNILTTGGSEFFRDFVPDYNATVVERCEKAGAILMGKTNTHELAFAPVGLSCFGQTRNPWDESRIPGGSSSGSAVAAATGMAYMAMGTDTGGSIRIPAALCGVVGYKPTFGLTSQYGVIPHSYSLDHIGPITRSVMDAAITMDIISGYDEKDECPDATRQLHTEFAKTLEKVEDLKHKKIGVPVNFFRNMVDLDIEKLYLEALNALHDLGAELVYIDMPLADHIPAISSVIMYVEAAHYHRERMETNMEGFGKPEQRSLTFGAGKSGMDYVEAIRMREQQRKEWAVILQSLDAVAVPTVQIPAPKIGEDTKTVNEREMETNDILVHNTRLGSYLGIPGLSIPIGLTKENLPAGLMLYGKKDRDIDVLSIGWVYEKYNPFMFL